MGLNIGKLIHDVTIQQLTETKGPSQVPVRSWTSLVDPAWMARESQIGSETFGASQLSAEATIVWTMRYLASMDPDLVDVPKARRLIYRGRSYEIVQAEHVGRQEAIMLTTKSASKVAA